MQAAARNSAQPRPLRQVGFTIPKKMEFVESGRPEEFHLQSPTDPYVNLSIHTAPASLALETSRSQADAGNKTAAPSFLVGRHRLRAGSSPSL